jgi:hypothetical protein
MKIGVICPSEIAFRRFMPALQKCEELEFAGVAIYNKEERFSTESISETEFNTKLQAEYEKAQRFTAEYGGKIYKGYEEIIKSDDVDAMYIPLPPALHYIWAKMALECGKHVLVEKPSTTSFDNTLKLEEIARKNNLALHENYMFIFHNQISAVDEIIKSGEIGNPRLIRISFGFPMRDANDFRYNKDLGGGALIDAGGYTLKYAAHLLGETARIVTANMNFCDEFMVDMYGSATMVNNKGLTAQISFGMDNSYKCDLEVWGSTGCLTTGRILTAPAGFIPKAIIRKGNDETEINLPEDDAFLKSINHFINCIENEKTRTENYCTITRQSELVEQFKKLSVGDRLCRIFTSEGEAG